MAKLETQPSRSNDGAVLTRATIRAADKLGVSQRILASVLGISEAAVSRMRNGEYTLDRSAGKAFELAAHFIRLFRSLDAIVGGDEDVARAWLRNENTVLRGKPIELIQRVQGLIHVIQYLDTRRAPV